jgi:hypothetical protein
MSRDAFLDALEYALRLRNWPFSRRDLQEFVKGMWSLVDEPADVSRWADTFLAAHDLAGAVPVVQPVPVVLRRRAWSLVEPGTN